MKAEDKAKAIYYAMLNAKSGVGNESLAKECALSAIKEINTLLWHLEPRVDEDLWLYREMKSKIPYYKEVEKEIEKL